MKDWQFWALMSSIWFNHPLGGNKGDKVQIVICILCVLMLIYSIFPWFFSYLRHF